ncbi:MAG: hypothetical protein QOH74_47 [Gaiellales bacterium]|nr:hypothetical protein [Gaiellales bacterium]
MRATALDTAHSEDLRAELARAADELLACTLTRTEVRAEIDRTGFSRAAWTAAAEAGWFEAALPEEHGGLGLGLVEVGGIARAVGRHLLPGPVADHAVALPLLVPQVPAPARERLLSAIAGRRLTVLVDGAASSAPRSARPQTTDGRITGTVDLVRFGAQADDLLVVADGANGSDSAASVVALVAASAEGVTVTAQDSFDPITCYATVALDAAPIDELLVVASAEADHLVAHLRAVVRLFAAAETAGAVRSLLDMSVAHALDREQFGKPIGSFQALQHLLADTAASVLLLEAATADAFGRATDPALIEPLSWQLKILAARVGRRVGEAALQVHGGIAFTVEHDVHRAVEHILALQGLYGDERQLGRKLGRALLRGDLEPWL